MKARHTPGPWQVNDRDPSQVCDGDGDVRGCAPIAHMAGTAAERRANAKHIVHCVNAHDDLVAALQRQYDVLREEATRIEALLALVKAGVR